ncbi:hypothetical protein [Mesorhizobium sp.]|uniref:hypothetical protein n=1 Tax=Mesorhizobium sp. TaxID=1871066 RepID=UPI0012246C4E|nr:hypothetical protein [Mesorhizobium sp.]TIN80729.1 MAG: hypothetical protein E5Y09_02590 [Mesorhizobium sp.]
MCGKRVSENGKRITGADMSSVALNEAKSWAEVLLDVECQGRKDREGPIRYRLARKLGIPESYLYRLQYKTNEMNDVRGSVYRALMLAYEDVCRRNEEAADGSRAERLRLRKINAVDRKPAEAGVGMDAPRD